MRTAAAAAAGNRLSMRTAAAAGNRLSMRSSSSREQAVNEGQQQQQQQQGTGCQ